MFYLLYVFVVLFFKMLWLIGLIMYWMIVGTVYVVIGLFHLTVWMIAASVKLIAFLIAIGFFAWFVARAADAGRAANKMVDRVR
jgi:hypothetical protein